MANVNGGTNNGRRIISQGYNICSATGTASTANPILVERDLDTTYEVSAVSNPPGGLTPPAGNTQVGSGGNQLPGSLITNGSVNTNPINQFHGSISPVGGNPVIGSNGAPVQPGGN